MVFLLNVRSSALSISSHAASKRSITRPGTGTIAVYQATACTVVARTEQRRRDPPAIAFIVCKSLLVDHFRPGLIVLGRRFLMLSIEEEQSVTIEDIARVLSEERIRIA